MLLELKVRNFAIVEDGSLELGSGMTAFTGETGAGKSLLLDAITLLLGAKAHANLVRSGQKSAEVEGCFDLQREPDRLLRAEQMGFECDDSLLLVRREIAGQESSKNRIWIQGRLATRTQLQELLGDWVEISGQHEFLRLGREDYLLSVVDQFGQLKDSARALRELHSQWLAAADELKAGSLSEAERESRRFFLEFAVDEFNQLGIAENLSGLEEQWQNLRLRLGSIEKSTESLQRVLALLEGGAEDSSAGALSSLQLACRELRLLIGMGSEFAGLSAAAEESLVQLQDLLTRVAKFLAQLEADPAQLEEAEKQLSRLQKLKRKHSVDTQGLIELAEQYRKELNALQSGEDNMEAKRQREAAARKLYDDAAEALHAQRLRAAETLALKWQKDLRALGMPQAELELSVTKLQEPRAQGMSRMEVLFSANSGQALRPIGKVASGGELSRIMLALKNIVAGRAEVGVYLFDEVDAGLGGETAIAVASRLRRIAKDNQVLVVTHLAQTAAAAHEQFRISKQTLKGQTRTLIEPLRSVAEREMELARMLGATQSKAAKSLAKELLRHLEDATP
jgi:DNA repair protein RecN (Recombination protein N)